MGKPLPGVEAEIVHRTGQGDVEIIEAPDIQGQARPGRDLADQSLLPVLKRELLAGEAALVQPELLEEPDGLVRLPRGSGIGSSDQSQAGPARSPVIGT